jgi:hypothetical protein
VGSASEGQAARQRLRLELWSWSAWLILGIVSYPAVLAIWLAPRAGVLAGLLVGLLVAYAASLGYAGRRELDRWLRVALVSAVAALATGLIARVADGADPSTAVLIGLLVAGEIVFVWHFLPWLVSEADTPESPSSMNLQPLARKGRRREPIRPAMGLMLVVSLLFLGLGAVWSRGESGLPNPTGGILALGILALAFMFLERLAFLERSAREGNLLMASGAYRKWVAGALLVLLITGALAAIAPLRQARERADAARTGTAGVSAPAESPMRRGLERATEPARSAMSRLAAGLGAFPRQLFPLLLLLLLLLFAAILLWGFRRSRVARWLLQTAARLLALAVRLWERLSRWLSAVFAPPREGTPSAEEAGGPRDPLADHFENPELLAGLTARQVVIRTYHLVLSFAEMLGHGRRRGQTPFEYVRVLSAAAPRAAESAIALTWAYAGAMYGGEGVAVPDPSSVRDCWHRISSALAASLTEEELALRRRAYAAARKLELSR